MGTRLTRQAADYELVFEEPPAPLRAVGEPRGEKAPAPLSAASTYVAPDSHRAHGTYVKYVVEKCRCEPCRKANREYERRRTHAMARPDEVWMPYVPAGPARRHLQELAAAGVGYKTVAKLAGLPESAVGKILWPSRYRGMKASKRIRPETAAKILAVTVEQASGAQKVPAGPTWRLLDDLLVRGFTRTWIATQLRGRPARALQVRPDLVRASTARRVEALHRRLQGVEAPPRNTRWGPR